MQKNYFAKIAYHMFKGNTNQINYFVKRQEETCGPITYTQLYMIEDMVDGLHVDEAVLRAADAHGVDEEGQVFGINELYI
jgi:N-acetylglucosamine-6-phosphate deacetylase